MERRKFLTNLCKAAAVATVVPTAIIAADNVIKVPLKDEWFRKYPLTPDECYAPIIESKIKIRDLANNWNEFTFRWNYCPEFDGPFDPSKYDKVEGKENTYILKDNLPKAALYDNNSCWIDLGVKQIAIGL